MPDSGNTRVGTPRRRFLRSAGVVGTVGLAGCLGGLTGGGDDSEEGEEEVEEYGDVDDDAIVVDYWELFSGGDGEAMGILVDEFNETHDEVQIRGQRVPWDEYYNRFFTSLSGGNPPDLAVSHSTHLRRWGGQLIDLDEYIGSETDGVYVDSIWESTEIEGTRVALPLDTHPLGLYYNRDILEEAGLDPDPEFADFEEFRQACDTIVENTDHAAFVPDPYMGGASSARTFYSFLRQLDGDVFSEDLSEVTLGSEQGLAATEFWSSISGDRGWDQPDTSDERGTRVFRGGDAAMMMNGTWYVGVLQEEDFDWGMTKPFVAEGGVQNRTWTDSHTLIVPRNDERSEEETEAAVTAAEWLTQNNLEWGTIAGHLPASEELLQSDELRESEFWDVTLEQFFEMAEADEVAYMPQLDDVDIYDGTLWNWLHEAYRQDRSPEDALQDGVEQFESVID